VPLDYTGKKKRTKRDVFHAKGHRFQSPNQWLRVLINQKPSIANHTSAKMPATRTSRLDSGAPETYPEHPVLNSFGALFCRSQRLIG
jgi:hypothetical protein